MKTLILFIFLLGTLACKAQHFEGKYILSTAPDEGSRIFIFEKGIFSEQGTFHVSNSIGKGSYFMKNNSLYLKYKNILNPDTSCYSIESQDSESSSANISVQIYDFESGQPAQAMIGTRDRNNKALQYYYADKNGQGNLILFNNKALGYFSVDYIGFNSVSIPVSKLLGKTSNIIIKLKPAETHYIEPHTAIYRIVKIDDNGFILSTKGAHQMVFKKIK